MRLQIGDVVRCVDPKINLGMIKGAKYRINHVHKENMGSLVVYFVKVDGINENLCEERFVLDLDSLCEYEQMRRTFR